MKWYHILIIIILISIGIYFYLLNQEAKRYKLAKELQMQVVEPKLIVENLIKQGKDFNTIKSEALRNGIIVVKNTDTITREFNPKRVTVEVIQLNCITTPCPQTIKFISIG